MKKLDTSTIISGISLLVVVAIFLVIGLFKNGEDRVASDRTDQSSTESAASVDSLPPAETDMLDTMGENAAIEEDGITIEASENCENTVATDNSDEDGVDTDSKLVKVDCQSEGGDETHIEINSETQQSSSSSSSQTNNNSSEIKIDIHD